MRRLASLLLLLALLAVPAGAAAAAPKTSFNDVEDEVMCDTCNVPLNVAESDRADQERKVIRELIAQGLTKQQIKDELVDRYGPTILADPPRSGFSLAAYVVPIAVVLALVALLVALVPRWRRRGPPPATPDAPALSTTDARRLDEDLARYEV